MSIDYTIFQRKLFHFCDKCFTAFKNQDQHNQKEQKEYDKGNHRVYLNIPNRCHMIFYKFQHGLIGSLVFLL